MTICITAIEKLHNIQISTLKTLLGSKVHKLSIVHNNNQLYVKLTYLHKLPPEKKIHAQRCFLWPFYFPFPVTIQAFSILFQQILIGSLLYAKHFSMHTFYIADGENVNKNPNPYGVVHIWGGKQVVNKSVS